MRGSEIYQVWMSVCHLGGATGSDITETPAWKSVLSLPYDLTYPNNRKRCIIPCAIYWGLPGFGLDLETVFQPLLNFTAVFVSMPLGFNHHTHLSIVSYKTYYNKFRILHTTILQLYRVATCYICLE